MRSTASGFNLALKLGVLTLGLAAIAAALLSIRQRRIAAAHEMVRAHQRVVQHDESLRRIRVQIAESLAPDRVQQLVATLGPMKAIPPEWASSGGVLVWAPVYTPSQADAAADALAQPAGVPLAPAAARREERAHSADGGRE